MEKIKRFFRDEEGVTALEYGLIAAFIALALVVALPAVRAWLLDIFGQIANAPNG